MTGWSVDVPGVESWLGDLDGNVSDLRASVTDAEDAFSGTSSALRGPVAGAFSAFAASRRDAPAELVTMSDNAVGAAVGAVAALSIGNEEMANRMRLGRVHVTGSWSFQGHGWQEQPW